MRVQSQPKVSVGRSQVGIQPESLQVSGTSLDPSFERCQNLAKVMVHDRHIRLEPDRFLTVWQGFGRQAAVEEHLAQVGQCRRE